MNYILKQFDEPLVKFSATTDTSEPEIQILWTNEEKAALLPLDLTLTPEGASRWLRRRTIPKNRAYVHSLLAKCGLNLNRPLGIISVCKGLSLNECSGRACLYRLWQQRPHFPALQPGVYHQRNAPQMLAAHRR